MVRDLLLASLCFNIVFVVMLVSVFLHERKIVSLNTIRDVVHLLGGGWVLLLWLFLSRKAAISVCLMSVVILVAVTLFSEYLAGEKFKTFFRKLKSTYAWEDELFSGFFFYAVGITVITYFFWDNKAVATAAILALTLGDGFASLIGKEFGKHPYKILEPKSLEGSLACFIFAALGIFVGLNLTMMGLEMKIVLSLGTAFLVTIIEGASSKNIDDLTIPVFVAMFLSLFV